MGEGLQRPNSRLRSGCSSPSPSAAVPLSQVLILRAPPLNFLHRVYLQGPNLLFGIPGPAPFTPPPSNSCLLQDLQSLHSRPITQARLMLLAPLLLQDRGHGQCAPAMSNLRDLQPKGTPPWRQGHCVIPIFRKKELEELSAAPVCRAGECQRWSSTCLLLTAHSPPPQAPSPLLLCENISSLTASPHWCLSGRVIYTGAWFHLFTHSFIHLTNMF